jgi:hypothetical protein
MAVFQDNFDDNSLDPLKWTAVNGLDISLSESSGEIRIAVDGIYNGTGTNDISYIQSVPVLDFRGKFAQVDLPSPSTNLGVVGTVGPFPSSGGTELWIRDSNNTGNHVQITVDQHVIYFRLFSGGSMQDEATTATGYNSHTKWKLEHNNSNNTWDFYTFDGSDWIHQHTSPAASWLPSQSHVLLIGYLYSANQINVTTRFDNLLTNAEPYVAPVPDDDCTGELPSFDIPDQDKIDALRALIAAGTQPEVFELAKVNWPSPTDAVYYAVMETPRVASVAPPVSPIDARLIPDGNPDWFLPVEMDSTIGDEEVDLQFWDGDGEISDLLVEHGEGIKVELFYWFPQVELMLPVWHGHLRQEDNAEIDVCKIKAVQGFRSSDANLPHRAHWQECQAIFGAVFDTQAEIDENDCPYNKHIGGSVGVAGFTSCPRRVRQDCIDRLGNNANFMLSHATVSSIIANNQTHGPQLYSTSFGNETSLKEPVRVVMGARRVYGMQPLVYRRDLNNNNPDHGFFLAEYECCEGPIQSIQYPRIEVGSETQDADPFHYGQRLGTQGQTPVYETLTEHSYSSTALFRYTFGWVDPSDVDPSQASGSAYIEGLDNIRVYTDEDTYTRTYTNNRAWQIAAMLTNKRWGFGYDYERLNIRSFIEAACWSGKSVKYTDSEGDLFFHIRGLSNVELTARKVQQQMEDICMAGRLSRPFLFNGKIHIVPYRALSSDELVDVPVFTDEGTSRNIVWENGKTSLTRSRISDLDLANRIECTFDNADNDYLETPARPVEDVVAQLAAGRVVGDFSRKTNIKKYPLLGVTVNAQAIKMSWSLLDLGPFDEGGLRNNLRLKCKAWFLDCLDLYPTKVIRVNSSQITRYDFSYFRVVKIKRLGNLQVELEVQAYPDDYMSTFEVELDDGIDPPTPPPPSPPFILEFGDITYSGGVLTIPIGPTG